MIINCLYDLQEKYKKEALKHVKNYKTDIEHDIKNISLNTSFVAIFYESGTRFIPLTSLFDYYVKTNVNHLSDKIKYLFHYTSLNDAIFQNINIVDYDKGIGNNCKYYLYDHKERTLKEITYIIAKAYCNNYLNNLNKQHKNMEWDKLEKTRYTIHNDKIKQMLENNYIKITKTKASKLYREGKEIISLQYCKEFNKTDYLELVYLQIKPFWQKNKIKEEWQFILKNTSILNFYTLKEEVKALYY